MVRTIRNKIIIATLLLILSIQVVSSLFQYNQVRSIFFKEFISGANNLSQAPFLDLMQRTQSLLNEGEEPDEVTISSIDYYIYLVQSELFKPMLDSREDLQEIKFFNRNIQQVAYSIKTDKGIEHSGETSAAKDKDPDEFSVRLVKGKHSAAVEKEDRVYIFIPFVMKHHFLGGLVLVYSDQRIIEARNSILLTSLGLMAFFIIVSTLLAIGFVRNVLTNPVQQMNNLMKSLAAGEFDQRFTVKNQDEIGAIGKAVNNLVDSLQAVLGDISAVMGGVAKGDLSRLITADLKGDLDKIKSRINRSISLLSKTVANVQSLSTAVEISAKELSTSAEMLSTSTAEQAATLEQISSAIVEVENHARENTKNSLEASKISNATLELVNKGNKQMAEMQASMNEIHATSLDVTKIIKVIDEIAFQTNLLALNAAVEAARAGKYGKGFAVVAEEVRNLASRSAEAARNTTSLIDSSLKNVEKGVANAEKTGALLHAIVQEVEKSTALVSLIAKSSQEQSTAITEINTGVAQVNTAVQQNSAVSEETASSSAELLRQSGTLQQEIKRFVLMDQTMIPTSDLETAEDAPLITGPVRFLV